MKKIYISNDKYPKIIKHQSLIEEKFKTWIEYIESYIYVDKGYEINAISAIKFMIKHLDKYDDISNEDALNIIIAVKRNINYLKYDFNKNIGTDIMGYPIMPTTYGQIDIYNALSNYNIVLVDGVSGTGKSYTSLCHILNKFDANNKLYIMNILQDTIDKTIIKIIGQDLYDYYLDKKAITFIDINYLNGFTLNDAILLVDNAHTLSKKEIKLALTRLGTNSSIILLGDSSLATTSDFIDTIESLKGIKEIKRIKINKNDIVRNNIIKSINKVL